MLTFSTEGVSPPAEGSKSPATGPRGLDRARPRRVEVGWDDRLVAACCQSWLRRNAPDFADPGVYGCRAENTSAMTTIEVPHVKMIGKPCSSIFSMRRSRPGADERFEVVGWNWCAEQVALAVANG